LLKKNYFIIYVTFIVLFLYLISCDKPIIVEETLSDSVFERLKKEETQNDSLDSGVEIEKEETSSTESKREKLSEIEEKYHEFICSNESGSCLTPKTTIALEFEIPSSIKPTQKREEEFYPLGMSDFFHLHDYFYASIVYRSNTSSSLATYLLKIDKKGKIIWAITILYGKPSLVFSDKYIVSRVSLIEKNEISVFDIESGLFIWKKDYISRYKQPIAFYKNSIYILSSSISSYNVADGNLEWEHPLKPHQLPIDPTIHGSGAVIRGERLYASDQEGSTYCLSLSGKLLWSTDSTKRYHELIYWYGAVDSEGHLIIQNSEYLFRFDKEGNLLWKVKKTLPKIAASFVQIDHDKNVYINNVSFSRDGNFRWNLEMSNENSSPIILKDFVLYTNLNKIDIYTKKGQYLKSYDAESVNTIFFNRMDSGGIIYGVVNGLKNTRFVVISVELDQGAPFGDWPLPRATYSQHGSLP